MCLKASTLVTIKLDPQAAMKGTLMDLMNMMYQQYSNYVDTMLKMFNYGTQMEGETAARTAIRTMDRTQALTDIMPADEAMDMMRSVVGNNLSFIQRIGLLTIETAGRNQQVVSATLARFAARTTQVVHDTAEEFEEETKATLHTRGRGNGRHASH